MQRSQRKLISVAILNMRFISLQRGKGRKKKTFKKITERIREYLNLPQAGVMCRMKLTTTQNIQAQLDILYQ